VKRGSLATGDSQFLFSAGSTNRFAFFISSGNNIEIHGNGNIWRVTTPVYRDPSAWFHLLLVLNTPDGTAQNRMRLYVNGAEVTTWSTNGTVTQNDDFDINSTTAHNIGRNPEFSNRYFDGYLADIHFIDGQALAPTSFGEFSATTGVWNPKAYTGSYGTNGFHLDFADNASTTTIGYDAAGSNDWTANNLSVTAGAGNDSLVDVPVNGSEVDTGLGGQVRGNYATWNPLDKGADVVLANGNLDMSQTNIGSVRATLGVSSGKWYWEIVAGSGNTAIGVSDSAALLTNYLGATAKAVSWAQIGNFFTNGVTLVGGSAPTYTTGDVIGVALNMDAGTVQFYKNNSLISASASGLTGTWFPAIGTNVSATTSTTNFGQRPFAYTAPSGFKALNTANLPAPVVTKPSDVMDVVLYTGTGASLTPTSSLGFSPDLVWIKSRSIAAHHSLFDAIRGPGKVLSSSVTNAEFSESASASLTAFNSNGFSLGTENAGIGSVNFNGYTYAAWCWDAGSSTVTNTSGSITSQVRANPSAGFSVVSFNTQASGTGTVGHGLGVAPAFIIVKLRTIADSWYCYHVSLGAANYVTLNTTAASIASSSLWNNTAPTSNVFTTGTGFAGSLSIVAYCFAPVTGYSAFGSYTGNGSTDGPFVYTGFRPRWVILKRTDSTSSWVIYDTSRQPANPTITFANTLRANTSDAESGGTDDALDIVSSGFKIRDSRAGTNASGGTFVYAAFAESPFAANNRAR
jgi:hypothetical protein